MDFDETLHALLGLMGLVVSVHVRHPGSRAAPALMLVTGTLTSAPEVVEQLGGSSEVFFCRIGNSPALSGFFLDRERFKRGVWDGDDDSRRLVIELKGGTALVVHEEGEHSP
ncbi:MAG: hypothetical protein ACJ76Z_04045 [Thermoleophilaceae bacterium]